MATWDDLTRYVRSNYKVAKEWPGMLQLVFNTTANRSQLVLLSQQTLMKGKEEWVVIESPFAELGAVSLQKVLEEVGDMVCGGVAASGAHVVLRHSVPLANLDVNEFERPLELVTGAADVLESRLFGGDRF